MCCVVRLHDDLLDRDISDLEAKVWQNYSFTCQEFASFVAGRPVHRRLSLQGLFVDENSVWVVTR